MSDPASSANPDGASPDAGVVPEHLPPSAEASLVPVRGTRMRAAREAAGLDVAGMAGRLRLSQAQVMALEADDLAALPPATFVRGFVRNYARALGLPGDAFDDVPPAAAMAAVAQATPELSVRPAMLLPLPQTGKTIESTRSQSNRRWLVAAVLVLVIGLVGGMLRLEHLREARELVVRNTEGPLLRLGSLIGFPVKATSVTAAPVGEGPPADPARPAEAGSSSAPASGGTGVVGPAATITADTAAGGSAPAADTAASSTATATLAGAGAPASALPTIPLPPLAKALPPAVAARDTTPAAVSPAAASPAAGSSATASATAAVPLSLRFDGDCWVEVRDRAGKVLFSGMAHAGEEKDLPVSSPVKVLLGNAAMARVMFDGDPVDLAGHIQDTVAKLSLDPGSRHP